MPIEKVIELLQDAGFEVRSSAFADAPTMVFGNLDNAIRLLEALNSKEEA